MNCEGLFQTAIKWHKSKSGKRIANTSWFCMSWIPHIETPSERENSQ